MSWNAPGSAFGAGAARAATTEAPLVVLFERDDAVAVPLLSQIRMAGYDVRAARTPVELFDNVQKHPVALILVDLGNAAAGRREFWVALDAQRRGRAIQVLTFRYAAAGQSLDTDFDTSARALADVEIRSPHEFAQLVEAVRQRVPLHGGALGNGMPPLGGGAMPGSNPLDARANNGYGGNGFAGGAYPPHGMNISPSTATPPSGLGGYVPGMSPALSDPYPASGGHFAPPAPTFSPFGPPSPASLGMPGAPSPASGFGPFQPYGQAPQSPFANPANVNPFAGPEANSPFAQPFTGNPFEAQGSGNPAPAPRNPFVTPDAPYGPGGSGASGGGQAGLRADGIRLDAYAGPEAVLGSAFGASDGLGHPSTNGNGSHANGHANHSQAFAGMGGMSALPGGAGPLVDEWVPPGGDDFPLRDVPAAPPGPLTRGAEQLDQPRQRQGGSDFPSYDTMMQAGSRAADNPRVDDATAPVSAQMQVVQGAVNGRAERALGTVLVEGALLTSQKLDVLKGIQRMLSSVDMDFRLGELALLFKFLSPDQLLAALLVSRGLVSPQQIAALGRIKQELGGSGMDYDLETLLIMFHILPAEELRRLRAELS